MPRKDASSISRAARSRRGKTARAQSRLPRNSAPIVLHTNPRRPRRKGKAQRAGGAGRRSSGRVVGARRGEAKARGTERIFVAVRPRPLTTQEKEGGSWPCVEVSGKRIALRDPKDAVSKDPLHRSRATEFELDHVFEPSPSNEAVFRATASRTIDSIMSGNNGTVFAYGATGSGKTYTMSGPLDGSHPGLITLLVSELLKRLRGKGRCRMAASYVEIYNEGMRDLLVQSEIQSQIVLREHPRKGVIMMGNHWEPVRTSEQVDALLDFGNKHRTTDSHCLNDASSRSHAIFQLRIEHGGGVRRRGHTSKLSLIDLAGSERAKKTRSDKKMLNEGANINKSLLTLAKCITALGSRRRGVFVPFRDSKLTRVLKDSLAGTCSTSMIACVSSSSCQFEEVRETLTYAHRARNIKIKPLRQVHLKSEPNIPAVAETLRDELAQAEEARPPPRALKATTKSKGGGGNAGGGTGGSDGDAGGGDSTGTDPRRRAAARSRIPQHKGAGGRVSAAVQRLADAIQSNFSAVVRTRHAMLENRERGARASADADALGLELDGIMRSRRGRRRGIVAGGTRARQLRQHLQQVQQSVARCDAEYSELKKTDARLRSDGQDLTRQAAASRPQDREGLLRRTLERCERGFKESEHQLLARLLGRQLEAQGRAIQEQQALLAQHGIRFAPLGPRLRAFGDLRRDFGFPQADEAQAAAAASGAPPQTVSFPTIVSASVNAPPTVRPSRAVALRRLKGIASRRRSQDRSTAALPRNSPAPARSPVSFGRGRARHGAGTRRRQDALARASMRRSKLLQRLNKR